MTRLYIFIAIVLLFSACNKPEKLPVKKDEYINVLDLQLIPQKQYNLDGFGFSDMGAWHGYSLPEIDSVAYHGGFSGPLLMKMYGQWFSKGLNRLQLKNNDGQALPYISEKTKLYSKPGILVQELQTANLAIRLSLYFVDQRTALVETSIENTSDEDFAFNPEWIGQIIPKDVKMEKVDNQVDLILPDSSLLQTYFSNTIKNVDLKNNELTILGGENNLAPGEQVEIVFVQRYSFANDNKAVKVSELKDLVANKKALKITNIERWKRYTSKITSEKNTDSENRLAVKCVQTLITNWRSPAGALKHNGIFPSVAYQGFYGFWSWDSWKHSVAVVKFDPFLAKEGIRSMFDFQDERGMVADCVYFDPKENNWRDTKAPLAAWSVYKVFENTGDTAFVNEMLPKLEKYHKWWYKDRDHNKNGICEYGSTDGTLIAAKWESGMDNAVRFDKTTILKNSEFAWSFNQESVDLNAYLQKEKDYLALLYSIAGNKKEAALYETESKLLAEKIRSYFWNENKGYFFDREMKNGDFITDFGPEGWTPLWTGLASEDQAGSVLDIVLDTTHFNTYVPFPTLDANHKKFNPLKGYWRGPVWLDQAYFGIESLRNYGKEAEANKLTRKLFLNAEGLLADDSIRENYHPVSGKGLNAKHFSWSAAHLLLLLDKYEKQ